MVEEPFLRMKFDQWDEARQKIRAVTIAGFTNLPTVAIVGEINRHVWAQVGYPIYTAVQNLSIED